MTITPEREREIEARCAAATAGPWAYRQRRYDDWGWVSVQGTEGFICQAKDPDARDRDTEDAHRLAGTDPWEANARFIAHARQDVEDLLSSYKERGEELERKTAALREIDAAIQSKGDV